MRLLIGLVVATAGLACAQPTPPTVSTFAASAVGVTNASLNGTANPFFEPTAGWFQWGTTTNYGNVTLPQPLGNGVGNTNFSRVIGGLSGGVTYHFRAVATNADGTGFGTNQSFTTAPAPVFTDIGAGMSGAIASTLVWGDFNNDGRLDLLLAGVDPISGHNDVYVWSNAPSGFIKVQPLAFGTALFTSSARLAAGDYNFDGRLDVLLGGFPGAGIGLYRNTGTGFNAMTNLPGLGRGTMTWVDYDNDGRLDVMIVNTINGGQNPDGSYLARNTRDESSGNPVFKVEFGQPQGNAAAVGDYNGDGWPDFFVDGGLYSSHGGIPANVGPAGAQYFNAAWGDYDNDGRPDILMSGTTNGVAGRFCQIWRNSGSGFTNLNAGLPGALNGSVAWGDYDNDGRLDVLLTGTVDGTADGAICQVWRNTGTGFTNINAGLPGVHLGTAAWGDYDNDGRLDIALTGTNAASVPFTQVWHNNTSNANTPPTTPTGLSAAIAGDTMMLSWNAASDAQTPASGLTYNVRMGTSPGASDLLSPMSDVSGARRLPQMGNAELQRFKIVTGLRTNQPVYWSVQAVDTAYAGSPFATERSFKILQWEAPKVVVPVTATNLPVGDYNGNGVIDENELNAVLTNYFPNSPSLQMTNVAGLGGTNVTFALGNSIAGAFSVEYTTNFSNWSFLGSATPRYLFTDTNAPAVPQRYYRLRWP